MSGGGALVRIPIVHTEGIVGTPVLFLVDPLLEEVDGSLGVDGSLVESVVGDVGGVYFEFGWGEEVCGRRVNDE